MISAPTQPSWWQSLFALTRFELVRQWRRRGDLATVLAFYFLILTLAPLGLSPASNVLRGVAPGLIWIAALLSVMLASERAIRIDHRDGLIEPLLFSGATAELIIASKIVAGWISIVVPLVIASPLIFALMAVPGDAMVAGAITIALGAPSLITTGLAAATLTAGARHGGALLALLLFPLQLPVLIFGAAALRQVLAGEPAFGEWQVLVAFWLGSVPIAIMAGAAGLRALIREGA
ncbi:MAG: heme exporter protein CcmB [Alphaproteobacteria bacterium]|nr:heme exporter protein CcmB [Alphaproteobacteria bacterium SS10]